MNMLKIFINAIFELILIIIALSIFFIFCGLSVIWQVIKFIFKSLYNFIIKNNAKEKGI